MSIARISMVLLSELYSAASISTSMFMWCSFPGLPGISTGRAKTVTVCLGYHLNLLLAIRPGLLPAFLQVPRFFVELQVFCATLSSITACLLPELLSFQGAFCLSTPLQNSDGGRVQGRLYLLLYSGLL